MDIKTTTDLKGLRMLLGLSPNDAANLIGLDKDWLLEAEKGRCWDISPQYRDALLYYEENVQDFIETVMETSDRFIITYPHDDVYRRFEPHWSALIPTSLMHLNAAIRAMAELERPLNLVTLFPKSYDEYLRKTRKVDDAATRQEWAAAYAKNYR